MMLWLLRWVGGTLGHLAFWCGIRSRVTMDNLARAYPDWAPAKRRFVAVKSYISLGKVFFEFLFLRYASKDAIERGLEITNLAEIKSYLSSPSGAILLSGHIGNWEWLALGCGLRLGVPLDVIIKNQRSRFAERFLVRMRSRLGNRMLDAGNVLAIFRALRNGELLAILGDQAAPVEDVRVPFFGREMSQRSKERRGLRLPRGRRFFFFNPSNALACGYRCRFHSRAL